MMKKLNVVHLMILFLFVSGIATASVLPGNIRGNGKIEKEERKVESFKGVVAGGAFDVYLKQGNETSLFVEADENLLPVIKTEVRGDILRISTTEGIKNSNKLNIYITMPLLEKLEVSGACEVKGEGRFNMENLELEASGASEVELIINTSSLDLTMSGSSEVELSGNASEFEVQLSGASELEAFELITDKCEIEASGASSADIYVNIELEVNASGASDINYKGEAYSKADVSGAASLDKK